MPFRTLPLLLAIAPTVLAPALIAPAAFAQAAMAQATLAPAAPAQSDLSQGAPTGLIHGRLPAPPVSENAPVAEILRAAQSAVVTGRRGEAQEALEMAQTRLLDRSVPLFQTNTPSQDPGVAAVSQALRALAEGDREATLRHIQTAMRVADAPAQ